MSYVDLYCERLAPGLMAEPVNTLSNLAFFAAAWLVWRRAASAGAWRARGRLLAALIALIGAGSFTFHAFATTWAEALDEFPILLFQLVFLGLYFRGVTGWGRAAVAGFLAAFVAAGVGAAGFPAVLNGSLVYLPALAVLSAIGAGEAVARRDGWPCLLGAAGTFVVSVGFRSADLAVCPRFALGTHFLWHLINAMVLALAVLGLLLSARSGETR
ncbi:ceramidase domain-containing protein [Crenobacter cavernae]|uniref:Ceramidase n=1 Tax=Crenobacter cavernae TaxID=2290923 RepID=A0ABY0FBM9_9NEIS|nr:ceramidase domain-containing protein [Crenobacter cavernae]RXZ42016.1 hypothetical protein EBB06_13275 [Crenobacter cavernae]